MKSKKGITLVSLVVTIIVLIILPGVSINLTLGENVIITMAKKARENMQLAQIEEERQLNELYSQIVTEGGSSGNASDDAIIRLVEFKRQIASAITDMGIETSENADGTTMSNNIRSILGTATADKISYDNTNSGLTATNVQGAVDELNDNLEQLITNESGDFELLAYSDTPVGEWGKTFVTYTINDINNYKYLYLSFEYNMLENPTLIPVKLWRNTKLDVSSVYIANSHAVVMKYNSDTSVEIVCCGYGFRLYVIK